MNYKYSVFISYKRDCFDMKFLENFKEMIQTEAGAATGVSKVFIDKESIKPGEEFDKKIYDCIPYSCFFIPLYQYMYLDENRIYCALELFHAIEVEKRIRITKPEFCFILPLIHRGEPKDLPKCIEKKNALLIHLFESDIITRSSARKYLDLKREICKVLYNNFRLLHDIEDVNELCNDIHRPDKEEILEWIRDHNSNLYEQEKNKTPKLKINGEQIAR